MAAGWLGYSDTGVMVGGSPSEPQRAQCNVLGSV